MGCPSSMTLPTYSGMSDQSGFKFYVYTSSPASSELQMQGGQECNGRSSASFQQFAPVDSAGPYTTTSHTGSMLMHRIW
jgi:hypothetical protein